jgi:hypothetical protein
MKNFDAIRYIYPDAVFSMIDDDPEKITWVGKEYPIPTAKQIKDALNEMKAAEEKENADKEAAKASALAKLEKLGLTADEVKAAFNI